MQLCNAISGLITSGVNRWNCYPEFLWLLMHIKSRTSLSGIFFMHNCQMRLWLIKRNKEHSEIIPLQERFTIPEIPQYSDHTPNCSFFTCNSQGADLISGLFSGPSSSHPNYRVSGWLMSFSSFTLCSDFRPKLVTASWRSGTASGTLFFSILLFHNCDLSVTVWNPQKFHQGIIPSSKWFLSISHQIALDSKTYPLIENSQYRKRNQFWGLHT